VGGADQPAGAVRRDATGLGQVEQAGAVQSADGLRLNHIAMARGQGRHLGAKTLEDGSDGTGDRGHGATSSTSPQATAVAASTSAPESAIQQARRRPMRRGIEAVPPAPGISPIDTSGSRNTASALATTRAAAAGTSIPAPTHAPCSRAVSRGP